MDSVPQDAAGHLLAVLREALSNIARHARASAASITVNAGDDLVLRVSDNGRGLTETSRRSGLRNMHERAAILGGAFEVTSQPDQGTQLEWRVPLGR